MPTPEATLLGGSHDTIQIPATADHTSGEVINLGGADDRAAIVTGLNATALTTGSEIAVIVSGPVSLASASGVTFAAGARVYWDLSANTAIPAGSAAAGDFDCGPAIRAKASGQLVVQVDLNARAGTVQA